MGPRCWRRQPNSLPAEVNCGILWWWWDNWGNEGSRILSFDASQRTWWATLTGPVPPLIGKNCLISLCLSSIQQCTCLFFSSFYFPGQVKPRRRRKPRSIGVRKWLSCGLRVALVCPEGINYDKNSHLRVAFVCGSGDIVWTYLGIVLASAVHWLLTKFGDIFAQNSKFIHSIFIWC